MRKKLFPKHSRHSAPAASPELDAILCELGSPEERTRANAVRKLCPCRGVEWGVPVHQQVLDLRNDPSPLVRHAVEHDLSENPNWNKRTEARKIEGQRVRREERAARQEIEAALTGERELPPLTSEHSLGWKTRPRRRTHGRHRLSR